MDFCNSLSLSRDKGMRFIVSLALLTGSCGGWCADATATGSQQHPLAAQIELNHRIHSAIFDSVLDRVDPENPTKPHQVYAAHMVIKGTKYSCSFSEQHPNGTAVFASQIARNDEHWQYLDGTRTMRIRLCSTAVDGGTPFYLPFPCPMPLSVFRALSFAKDSDVEDARMCWSDISSPAWLAAWTNASFDQALIAKMTDRPSSIARSVSRRSPPIIPCGLSSAAVRCVSSCGPMPNSAAFP